MGLADTSTQFLVEGKRFPSISEVGVVGEDGVFEDTVYDGFRTLRWTLMGLFLHGPYFLAGFSIIDRRFAASSASSAVSWKTVAKKTVTAQLVIFPPYLVMLFGILGYFEGHPDISQKIRTKAPEAFVSGCFYWPVANAINFKLVPNHLRVPYLALSSGFWNSYLSYSNSHHQQQQQQDGKSGNQVESQW
jgi:protein Mpv17